MSRACACPQRAHHTCPQTPPTTPRERCAAPYHLCVCAHPCLPTPGLLAGHSLGGGAAGLLAALLKGAPFIPGAKRERLRAVCLAPAASMSARCSHACASFITSIIYSEWVGLG